MMEIANFLDWLNAHNFLYSRFYFWTKWEYIEVTRFTVIDQQYGKHTFDFSGYSICQKKS